MLGPDGFLGLAFVAFLPHPAVPLAYVGLGPGQELIPYFFALIGMIGMVIVAILQWPFLVLLRWLRRKNPPKGGQPALPAGVGEPEEGVQADSAAVNGHPLPTEAPEASGEPTPSKP